MLPKLKQLRQEYGISQQRLADAVNVSQPSINKYENQNGLISLGGEPKATFPMGGLGGGAKS